MTGYVLASLIFLGGALIAALGELINEEVRGWIDYLPRVILRLAASRLDPASKITIYEDEWLPELTCLLRGAEARPISRVILGVKYSVGLLIKAKRIADHLHRTLPGIAQSSPYPSGARRPVAVSPWGELQLRRVAELTGMSARCDFEEQVTDGTPRPDMVIRLAGGKNIVVDSKVSLAAYLKAAESNDDTVRANILLAHARHLREHVGRLADKTYWTTLSPSPEFVILFIPGEEFLAPALERDPGLLEYALGRKVHIATPTTLATMLRTAHFAWQHWARSESLSRVYRYLDGEPDDLDTTSPHQHLDECGSCADLRAKILTEIRSTIEPAQ